MRMWKGWRQHKLIGYGNKYMLYTRKLTSVDKLAPPKESQATSSMILQCYQL